MEIVGLSCSRWARQLVFTLTKVVLDEFPTYGGMQGTGNILNKAFRKIVSRCGTEQQSTSSFKTVSSYSRK